MTAPRSLAPARRSGWHAPSSEAYRADIDGLRCIAVIAVVAFHTFPHRLPGGFAGVDVFFVISGYLITGILIQLAETGRPFFREFYRRRIRRIFPALILVMATTLAIGFARLLASEYAQLGKDVAAGAAFVSNLVLWSEASYFDVNSATKPLLHLWSLGVEEQFYIGWPVLMLMIARRKLDLLCAVGLIAAASFLISVLLVSSDPTAAFYSPFSRFWELLAGAALLAIERRGLTMAARVANAVSLGGAVLLAGSIVLLNSQSAFPGIAAIAPVLGTTMLVAAGPWAAVNRYVLSLRPVVEIGLFSYPLYLWHWPLLTFVFIANFQVQPAGIIRFGLVGASIALGWLTYRLVEKPECMRRLYTTKNLSLAMLLLFVIGAAIFLGGGWKSRPVESDERLQFVARYQSMHATQIAGVYRSECDFVKWGTLAQRDSIDQRCVEGGSRPYVLLWGDSHAQALSLGVQKAIGTIPLKQVATSGCRPDDRFDKAYYPNPALRIACDRSNRFALNRIAAKRPDLVIIAMGGDHLEQDWQRFADHLHRLGAARILLVGPLPQWQPSLPLIITARAWPYRGQRVAEGLDPKAMTDDVRLKQLARNWSGLHYVSLIETICNRAGCMAQVPGQPVGTLMTLDSAHLTPQGSTFLGRSVLGPAIVDALATR